MQITTNWVPRNLVALCDMPEKARKDFDYITDDDYQDRFVEYKGDWIDVYDTQRIHADVGEKYPMGWGMRVHPGSPLCLFDAIIGDSYFSGTLIRFVGDDQVVVARYYG